MYYGFFLPYSSTVSNRCFFQNIGVRQFFFADVCRLHATDQWSTSMHSSSAKKVNTAPFATQINPQQSQYPWKITF